MFIYDNFFAFLVVNLDKMSMKLGHSLFTPTSQIKLAAAVFLIGCALTVSVRNRTAERSLFS